MPADQPADGLRIAITHEAVLTRLLRRPKATTLIDLHASPDDTSRVTARVEPKVQAPVEKCNGSWCHLDGRGFAGWIAQGSLWGVYPDEKF